MRRGAVGEGRMGYTPSASISLAVETLEQEDFVGSHVRLVKPFLTLIIAHM